MAQSFYLREQAERCRRLARDTTDTHLRDHLLKLTDEYGARAEAQENGETRVWQAGSDDRDDA